VDIPRGTGPGGSAFRKGEPVAVVAHPAPPLPPVRATNLALGFSLALVAAGVVAALGIAGEDSAVSLGAVLSGASALVSGAILWLRGFAGPRRARFRRMLGLSLVVWSVGQLYNGFAVALGPLSFPSPGDLISLCAAPAGAIGILAVPRRSSGIHPGLRIGLDSALLGIAFALLGWHLVFADAILPGPFTSADASALVVIAADITVVCLGILAFIRDFDRNLLLVSAGGTCYAAGDLLTLHSSLEAPGNWPWQAAVLWCLAWPLIAAGLLRYQPRALIPVDRESAVVDPEARGVTITTTVSLSLLLISLGLLAVSPRPDRVSVALVIAAVVVFWARELLNARFRAQLLRRLHDEATADPLTGLANRRVLAEQMGLLPRGEAWCLLTVDLDGFKDVNDLLGHATGDRLLAAVAHRLAEAVPDEALVSRIGGDEFAVLLPGELAYGATVGEHIVTAVRRSAADVEGVARVEVSASVGVAAVNAGDAEPRTLVLPEPADGLHAPGHAQGTAGAQPVATVAAGLADVADAAEYADVTSTASGDAADDAADSEAGEHGDAVPVVDPLGALSASGAALRVAKAAGRNRVEIYDAGIARMRRRRLRVEERLRAAVDSGDITVLYQPIVDLKRGVVTGAEALARWSDPQLGVVDPGEFIPVAEQTGLVVGLGERVLDETLGAAVREGLFDRGLRLSCNVSPVQLRVAGFHRVVQEALQAHGVDRDRLVVEVTEQVVVEEGQPVQTLHRLAELGVTIAIDDFGTGYSALGYLQRLPAEVLKIDRSLTSSLVGEPRSRAITRAVLDMGTTVGLTVVVEGVESEEVDDLVRRMGVGYAQGSYYGTAMSAPELAAMSDRLSSGDAPRGAWSAEPADSAGSAGSAESAGSAHPYTIRQAPVVPEQPR
jgi:diguanylate cyclase (GGDEF)-like protein